MDKEDLDKLAQVINTLNAVPVAGKANLSMLLGCIGALENIAVKHAQEKQEE